MNFAPFNSHTNDLFADNNILKFKDIIQMELIKIVYEFKNKILPAELLNLFKSNSDVHTHFTRNVANEGLYIPQIYNTNFGERSLKYYAAVIWNRFIQQHKEINNFNKIGALKHYLKNNFLSVYKDK